jgi:TfoX/Sxy family transcriptional regulator of competence genes
MIYYDIVTWISDIIQSVTYDNNFGGWQIITQDVMYALVQENGHVV